MTSLAFLVAAKPDSYWNRTNRFSKHSKSNHKDRSWGSPNRNTPLILLKEHSMFPPLYWSLNSDCSFTSNFTSQLILRPSSVVSVPWMNCRCADIPIPWALGVGGGTGRGAGVAAASKQLHAFTLRCCIHIIGYACSIKKCWKPLLRDLVSKEKKVSL